MGEHGRAAVDTARSIDEPSILAMALVLASWTTVFEDADRALAMVEEASRLAEGAGDATTRDLADSYRGFHLAFSRRWDEAIAQTTDVVARAGEPDNATYATYSAAVAAATCTALSRSGLAATLVEDFVRRSESLPMWSNQLLVAAAWAATGNERDAAELVIGVRDRMARARQQGLPDLLVPSAILAHARDEDQLARRWLRAVREAPTPTQSFTVSILYHRAREIIGIADDGSAGDTTLADIGADAMTWVQAVAAETSE